MAFFYIIFYDLFQLESALGIDMINRLIEETRHSNFAETRHCVVSTPPIVSTSPTSGD